MLEEKLNHCEKRSIFKKLLLKLTKGCVFYVTEKLLNDENAFYFTLKALFVLKYFVFCSQLLSWPFGHTEKNGLIREISKFMTSQPV